MFNSERAASLLYVTAAGRAQISHRQEKLYISLSCDRRSARLHVGEMYATVTSRPASIGRSATSDSEKETGSHCHFAFGPQLRVVYVSFEARFRTRADDVPMVATTDIRENPAVRRELGVGTAGNVEGDRNGVGADNPLHCVAF